MVLATLFVWLPFVVREVIPVLREIGTDQEEAAYTLGASQWRTFWRVTLPAIRWGVIYGVILTTARSLGEYGAVAVVSGKIAGKTETLTTHVEERYLAFDLAGAYTASIVLPRSWPARAARDAGVPIRPLPASSPVDDRRDDDDPDRRMSRWPSASVNSRQALRGRRRPRRCLARDRRRLADRAAGAVGQRQDDAPAHHRRPGGPRRMARSASAIAT